MIRKGSLIFSNVFGRKTPDPYECSDFCENKSSFIEILQDKKKTNDLIKSILMENENNYCVKIRFCSAVLEYEKIMGTETEQKMKNSLHDIFLKENSMFKIETCHKDIIKIKNEIMDDMLKNSKFLNILKHFKDTS